MWRVLIGTALTLALGQTSVAAEDFLAGAELYADVARYARVRLTRRPRHCRSTSREIPEPVASAFAEAVRNASQRGAQAFK